MGCHLSDFKRINIVKGYIVSLSSIFVTCLWMFRRKIIVRTLQIGVLHILTKYGRIAYKCWGILQGKCRKDILGRVRIDFEGIVVLVQSRAAQMYNDVEEQVRMSFLVSRIFVIKFVGIWERNCREDCPQWFLADFDAIRILVQPEAESP